MDEHGGFSRATQAARFAIQPPHFSACSYRDHGRCSASLGGSGMRQGWCRGAPPKVEESQRAVSISVKEKCRPDKRPVFVPRVAAWRR